MSLICRNRRHDIPNLAADVAAADAGLVGHPGCVAAFFWFSGIALASGSLWALIPAAVAYAVLVVRTCLEDRTLQ
jgi:protein-S-isoprenylcysteine O-methyltransferase Ste14